MWEGLPGTNTGLLRKFVNYGRKKVYNFGTRQLERVYGKYYHRSLMFMGHVHKSVLILVAILLKFQLNLQKKTFTKTKKE